MEFEKGPLIEKLYDFIQHEDPKIKTHLVSSYYKIINYNNEKSVLSGNP